MNIKIHSPLQACELNLSQQAKGAQGIRFDIDWSGDEGDQTWYGTSRGFYFLTQGYAKQSAVRC